MQNAVKVQSKKKKILKILLILAIYVVQAVVCMKIAVNKKYLFTDEAYSYGLANSEAVSFLDPGMNPSLLEAWQPSSFFRNYLQYDNSVGFSFHAAFVNQAADVHPPFYYCLIHIMSFFFKNTIYSAVPGILLNVFFLLFVDVALFYVAKKLLKSDELAYATLVLYGLSAACFSNAVFIRMYLLQTLQLLLLVAFHVAETDKEKYTINDAIPLILLVALGGLTQYYYYFFAATLGACVCVYLLLNKRFKLFVGYAVTLWCGVGLALLIFPETIFNHVLSYRGSYATDSLGGFTGEKFKTYFKIIDSALFGKTLRLIALGLLLTVVGKLVMKKIDLKLTTTKQGKKTYTLKVAQIPVRHTENTVTLTFDEKGILLGCTFIAAVCFTYVAIQGSEIVSARYIYAAFPFVALFIVWLYSKIFKGKNAYKVCIAGAFVLAALSIHSYGIDWRYADYVQQEGNAAALEGSDCVIVYPENGWCNILQGINLYINMDETHCMKDNELEKFQQTIDERATKENPVCVAFYSDAHYSEEDKQRILNEIIDNSQFTGYELSYDYGTQIYTLS